MALILPSMSAPMAPVFDLKNRDAAQKEPDIMIEAYHKRDSDNMIEAYHKRDKDSMIEAYHK
ncbi:MAG: hypothetical protein HETSPECPRED_009759 [Heterodermia speciosa]|uniref:Uncharacterized protein n=1 Tax=Heterodermia speciosa TaxID=116794 RepID=A0A8H3G2A3_9LECA|nr:MAG: hypothetical protein HETSPECPRED_009759 [Heterodermia speciosa]